MVDLQEIRPNRFLIYNTKAKLYLRGEGVTVGNQFELTTWRREGLLGRLRMHGFKVHTINDRIAALPQLPEAVPVGDESVRGLQHPKERFACFDLATLRWREIEAVTEAREVMLREGWVLRRRRGRGNPSYYIATLEKPGRIGLKPQTETDALLMGYAQTTARGTRSIVVPAVEDEHRLPGLLLPPPHREVLKAITNRHEESTTIPAQGWEQAQALFGTLRLALVPS